MGIGSILGGLIGEPCVFDDGDAIRGTVRNPQFVGSARVEFQVSRIVEIIG